MPLVSTSLSIFRSAQRAMAFATSVAAMPSSTFGFVALEYARYTARAS